MARSYTRSTFLPVERLNLHPATVAERTARFWSVNRRGPTGPMWRPVRDLTGGIVDFNARRAIIRAGRRGGGLLRHVTDRLFASPFPAYVLVDDVSLSIWTGARWTEPDELFQPGLPRLPRGLSFLDLFSAGSLVDVAALGSELVRGVPAVRYELTLDVDDVPWPASDRGLRGRRQPPRIEWLIGKLAPSPSRRRGVIPAEVWIDEPGRFVRFSYCDVPRKYPNHEAIPWPTTELWDFGLPPEIQDWRIQPDPTTLQNTFDAGA